MNEKISLNTFPSGKASALTMLYLEKMDTTGFTPEQLAEKYTEVFEKIDTRLKELKKKS